MTVCMQLNTENNVAPRSHIKVSKVNLHKVRKERQVPGAPEKRSRALKRGSGPGKMGTEGPVGGGTTGV